MFLGVPCYKFSISMFTKVCLNSFMVEVVSFGIGVQHSWDNTNSIKIALTPIKILMKLMTERIQFKI